jgi:flagellar biosynthesis/type III secretory pathway chaperone
VDLKWEKLLTVFTEILIVHQKLLQCAVDKKAVLQQNDIKALEAIMQQEGSLVFQGSKLLEIRDLLVGGIAAEQGIAGKKPDLSVLLRLGDADAAVKLKQTAQEIRDIAGQIAKLNGMNQKLIDQALSFVNYNVNLLMQNAVGPTYASRGNVPATPVNRRMFDRKA